MLYELAVSKRFHIVNKNEFTLTEYNTNIILRPFFNSIINSHWKSILYCYKLYDKILSVLPVQASQILYFLTKFLFLSTFVGTMQL